MIREGAVVLGLCGTLVLGACRGPVAAAHEQPGPTESELPVEEPSVARVLPAPAVDLPADWRVLGREAFEHALEASLPPGSAHGVGAAALAELAQALQSSDESALRAVAWLARIDDPRAVELLFYRLERRRARATLEEGPAMAIDFAAAAALRTSAGLGDNALRLEELVIGKNRHPDLDVRVECSRSALHGGRDGVIPFLLAVLRSGTALPGARFDAVGEAELAWCQARAAAALSERARLLLRFRPEAALAERERALLELEAALGAQHPGGDR